MARARGGLKLHRVSLPCKCVVVDEKPLAVIYSVISCLSKAPFPYSLQIGAALSSSSGIARFCMMWEFQSLVTFPGSFERSAVLQ